MAELYVSTFTDENELERVIIYRSAECLRDKFGSTYAQKADFIGTIGRADLTDEAGSHVDAFGYWSDTAAHFIRDHSRNLEVRK